MRFPRLPVLALALLPAACGGAAQNRPVVVATFPAHGQELDGFLREIEIRFDEPVRVLSPTQVLVRGSSGGIAVTTNAVPGDSFAVRVVPVEGAAFATGSISVVVEPGLVVNAEDHYALEEYEFGFVIGTPALLVGRPGLVQQLDPDDFSPGPSTATPGGRLPVGLASTEVGGVRRGWAQLADGAGTAASLCVFTPGDPVATVVPLTVAPGGDLTATADGLVTSRDGRTIYAAWRDTAAGRVRLHAIDAASETEWDSVLLSPPAGGAPAPLGLALSLDGRRLHVACADATGDRLVEVDLDTFVETDRGSDAGVDGLPLPAGAGPVAALVGGRASVAPVAQATAWQTELFDPDAGTLVEHPVPTVAGAPATLLATRDGAWLVEGLAGYTGGVAVVAWPTVNFEDAREILVSDDTPGADPAASALRVAIGDPARNRLLLFLDDHAVAVFAWDFGSLVQTDLDDVEAGDQAADLSGTSPDVVSATFLEGSVAP